MHRYFTVLLLIASFALSGCISKSDHEALQSQLEECRTDKQAAQVAFTACEKRFDREIARFDTLDSTLEEAVPDALATFRAERQEILEQVPVQVRDEVESYLDEFATAVGRSFQRLSEDNDKILAELGTAQLELTKLGVDTESLIVASRESTIQEVRVGQASRKDLDARSAEIVSKILKFDRERINCKDCDNRLRLNKKEIQAITEFHATLIEALQVFATPTEVEDANEVMEPISEDDPATDPDSSGG